MTSSKPAGLCLTGCSSCGEASRSLINLLQNFAHQGQDHLGLRLRNRSPEVSVRHVVAHQAHFVGNIFNQFVYEAGAVQGVYALVETLPAAPFSLHVASSGLSHSPGRSGGSCERVDEHVHDLWGELLLAGDGVNSLAPQGCS